MIRIHTHNTKAMTMTKNLIRDMISHVAISIFSVASGRSGVFDRLSLKDICYLNVSSM